VQAFRASGARGQIGNQHNLGLVKPASDKEEDVAAASRSLTARNLLYLDSQLRGEYPKDLVELYGAKWPTDAIKEGDLATISAPIDYFGLDYGTSEIVQHDSSKEGGLLQAREVASETSTPYANTARDVRDSLAWVRDRYGNIPMIVLECGEGLKDTVVDGRVNDSARVTYLREYVTGVQQALLDGINLRGCFVWSFLDGWEFGHGLSNRYGLLYVDFETQQRIVKDSGNWYRDMIAANGLTVAT
jgi:beta-glucosidase